MAFPNVKSILRRSSGLNAFKLLLLAAASSRPMLKGTALLLIQPFVKNGKVRIRYTDQGKTYTVFLRTGDLLSDYQSVKELAIDNVYPLNPAFAPDLVVDGGGNIGMFTLRAAASYPRARKLICEPVPRNREQLLENLRMNDVEADLRPVCIGGTSRTMPFYVREANQGSFDPEKPYSSQIDVDVVLLADLTAFAGAERIMVKLDIEGMELEVLDAYVPGETRAVCIYGELHGHKTNKHHLERIFRNSGWDLAFYDVGDAGSVFKAISPAAKSLRT